MPIGLLVFAGAFYLLFSLGGPSVSPEDASATPMPHAAAESRLAPSVGKRYRFLETAFGDRAATYVITAVADEAITYDLTIEAAGTPPVTRRGLTASRVHGAYWFFDMPNPVSGPVAGYPSMTVAVPAGRFRANYVVGGTATAWFVAGVPVRVQTSGVEWTLHGVDRGDDERL